MEQVKRITVINGNPKYPSRTGHIADKVSRWVEELLKNNGFHIEKQWVELAELAPYLFEWENPVVKTSLNIAADSDLLVIASPTFKASYTGLLKVFLDLFPSNGLAGVIAIPLMVGAASTHALAVETQLRPVLIELGAVCPTRGLYFLDSMEELSDKIASWISDAGPTLLHMLVTS